MRLLVEAMLRGYEENKDDGWICVFIWVGSNACILFAKMFKSVEDHRYVMDFFLLFLKLVKW